MTAKARLRIFCYDISDNKIRRKVATILEDNATRVQFSVFEARLTKIRTKKVIHRIHNLLEKGDNLRVYTVGKSGERHCEVFGSTIPIEKETGYWLF